MAVKKKKKEAIKPEDIIKALSILSKEKKVNMDMILDALKHALASAARKYLNQAVNVEVNIHREKGTIEVYTRQYVVDEVEDPETQISIEDARKIDESLESGNELIQDLDIALFGRSAVQTAKQIVLQRVREAEREKIFNDYSERIGELVTGTIQQIDRGNILLNLGRTEALLPHNEQINKERHRQGDTIRGCIVDVTYNPKGPQIIISRTSPLFLERLFELEVPEIFESIVSIIKVVRAPGYRAKVAVSSNDSRVDPVGACVGMRGNRVQAIVRELSNERMDIINWTTDFSLLVKRVFSPAEVKKSIPVGENKLIVIVSEEDLAQAIGREGQNIKLASKMLEKNIDIYGDEEYFEMSDEEKKQIINDAENNESAGVISDTETENDLDIDSEEMEETEDKITEDEIDEDEETDDIEEDSSSIVENEESDEEDDADDESAAKTLIDKAIDDNDSSELSFEQN